MDSRAIRLAGALTVALTLGPATELAHAASYQYTYDIRGRLVSVTASNGVQTSYTYDDAGNRTAQTVTVPAQTFTSDNNGDHWVGTGGNDTFNLGRGGDVVTGNGGNDTFKFAEVPWAGAQITDFNAGDVLDLTGLVSSTGYAGSNPFADGYLKFGTASDGSAQVLANYNTTGNTSWWLVVTITGVSVGQLQANAAVITIGSGSGGGAVSTADANYTAAANVTSITLTGSQQHIDASLTNGVVITSNDTGNTLIGGGGADVFNLGRGGDTATGGAGADKFAYAQVPWAAGVITDFKSSQGDTIDVTGLVATTGYTGTDPFGAGYLKYTTAADGSAQLWANLPNSGGWWLVATITGVAPTSLNYNSGIIH